MAIPSSARADLACRLCFGDVAGALAPQPALDGLPGLVLRPADARGALRLTSDAWDRRYLTLTIRHDGAHCGRLFLRFWAAGESERRIELLFGILPGVRLDVSFDLSCLDGQHVFLRRHPGLLKAVCFGRRIDPGEIAFATLELDGAGGGHSVAVGGVVLGDTDRCAVRIAEPMVDALGQWRQREWPGKTRDEAQLTAELRAAAAEPAATWPDGWSACAGSLAHRFPATGFFRTHHDGRRWWLVDPDGCGFWSAGLDCVRPEIDSTVVPGTEPLFSWLPDAQGGYADCVRPARGGHGQPGRGLMVDFGTANLRRAFGDAWRARWSALTASRLRRWRFTTVANWSDLAVPRAHRIPYVMPMTGFPGTQMSLFRDLPDVFDPTYAESARVWAQQLAAVRDDHLLIGYFLANEPQWGFGSFNLAAEMLEANPGSHTRRELSRWVSQRYSGDTGAWRLAWGLEGADAAGRGPTSFEDLVTGVYRRLDASSPSAKADLWEFSKLIVRRHAQIPSDAARAVDPNHLNLGLRYAWIASELFYEAGACFDVFSINCYGMLPDAASIAEIRKRCGKPTLIGEFHWGALDRGLPSSGLRAVVDQAERGVAYRRYVEACAANPDCIGCHYFTLDDQSLTGRFDGENYQIGFVDTCHRPYPELVAAATATHERLYGVVDGSLAPFAQDAREVPRVSF